MARTIRSANLDTRNKRLDLELRTEHCCTLSAGCYLIYYRPLAGNGVWRARWRTGGRTVIGRADDYIDADGVEILTWEQATKKAGEWFRKQARLAHQKATGEAISDAPYTVADALGEYQRDIRRRRR